MYKYTLTIETLKWSNKPELTQETRFHTIHCKRLRWRLQQLRGCWVVSVLLRIMNGAWPHRSHCGGGHQHHSNKGATYYIIPVISRRNVVQFKMSLRTNEKWIKTLRFWIYEYFSWYLQEIPPIFAYLPVYKDYNILGTESNDNIGPSNKSEDIKLVQFGRWQNSFDLNIKL